MTRLNKVTHVDFAVQAQRPQRFDYTCGGFYSLTKARTFKKKLLNIKFADGSPEFKSAKIYKQTHYKKIEEVE